MPSVEIRPDVYWIGINDRTTDLFEGIWPVSDAGVTYNSYVISDEKNAIVDLAKGFKTDEYFELLDSIIPLGSIDYIVINHMEPDHTGAIRALSRIAPKCTLIATGEGPRDARRLLRDHREYPHRCRRRGAGPREEDAALRAHAIRPLARDHGHLRRHRPDSLFLRRIRRVRNAPGYDVRRPGCRPSVLRARGPALLREHRGEVQHPDTERNPEARRSAHRCHRPVSRAGVAARSRQDHRAVQPLGHARKGGRGRRRSRWCTGPCTATRKR